MIRAGKTPRGGRNPELWPGNFKLGMWVWLLQRVTGLALVFYLFMHIWVISYSAAVNGKIAFDSTLQTLQSPFFIALDLLLVATVLFHALNGIRILLFDFGIGIRSQKTIFWGLMVFWALALIGSIVAVFPFLMGKPLV